MGDNDGTIDYEEFLHALHPDFQETPNWFWSDAKYNPKNNTRNKPKVKDDEKEKDDPDDDDHDEDDVFDAVEPVNKDLDGVKSQRSVKEKDEITGKELHIVQDGWINKVDSSKRGGIDGLNCKTMALYPITTTQMRIIPSRGSIVYILLNLNPNRGVNRNRKSMASRCTLRIGIGSFCAKTRMRGKRGCRNSMKSETRIWIKIDESYSICSLV